MSAKEAYHDQGRRMAKGRIAIRNAFLSMRTGLPVNKIRIQDLCARANVNKSTFYRYYFDIYVLQEELEMEFIRMVVTETNEIQSIYTDPRAFFTAFDKALNGPKNILTKETLFHDDYDQMLKKLEEAFKQAYLQENRNDFAEYVRLSYILGGAFSAFLTLYNNGGVHDTAPIYALVADMSKEAMRIACDAERKALLVKALGKQGKET